MVGTLRGAGPMSGADRGGAPPPGSPSAPARRVGARLAASAYENGLVVRAMRDTVGFRPPLIIDEGDVEEIGSKMKKALQETEKAIQAKSI